MRMALLAATALLGAFCTGSRARAVDAEDGAASIRRCITAAAEVHRVPPLVLVILLRIEGGSLSAVSQNMNDTVDIGPMQVNQIWIREVAAHWHATRADTYYALRDSFCANVEAGAWILRRGLDEAHGDFWEGVGHYQSRDPAHKASYLRLVLKQALLLQDRAGRAVAEASRPPAHPLADAFPFAVAQGGR